jgi:hypothetical protein
MEFGVQHIQNGKLGLHIAQAVLIFVAWILDIAVFRSSANVDGRLGWNFGVVSFASLLPNPNSNSNQTQKKENQC